MHSDAARRDAIRGASVESGGTQRFRLACASGTLVRGMRACTMRVRVAANRSRRDTSNGLCAVAAARIVGGMSTPSSIVSRIAHDSYRHAPPSILPGGSWWENLESNFCDRPEGFELEPWDWARVNATAAVDLVMRTWGGTLLAMTMPRAYLPWPLAGSYTDTPDDWQLYIDLVQKDQDPSAFFRPPAGGVRVTEYEPRWRIFEPEDGRCIGLKFESPYEPWNPRLAETFANHRNNRTARARWWRHDGAPRPVLLAIHGFMADPYWINVRFFSLKQFYEMGYDVVLATLPHHGLRSEAGTLSSGLGFFTAGMSGVNEHMAQAICDLRVLMGYLRGQCGIEKIAVTGVSLGGWTASMLASLDDDIDAVIPNVPVVSPVDLLLEWQPAGAIVRTGLFALRWSVRYLREIMAVSTPLTYQPKLPPERLMIIGGVGDRLAPPKHSRLLWDHWGRCRIHWFPGNHVVHLDRGEYIDQIVQFLGGLGFVHGERATLELADVG
jgi:pimeloyl-ACP methyl ester carboxylesterase